MNFPWRVFIFAIIGAVIGIIGVESALLSIPWFAERPWLRYVFWLGAIVLALQQFIPSLQLNKSAQRSRSSTWSPPKIEMEIPNFEFDPSYFFSFALFAMGFSGAYFTIVDFLYIFSQPPAIARLDIQILLVGLAGFSVVFFLITYGILDGGFNEKTEIFVWGFMGFGFGTSFYMANDAPTTLAYLLVLTIGGLLVFVVILFASMLYAGFLHILSYFSPSKKPMAAFIYFLVCYSSLMAIVIFDLWLYM